MNGKTFQRYSGMTLIEVLCSLLIISAAGLGINALVDQYAARTRTTAVAEHMATFGHAVQKYVDDNYAAVAALATATQPVLIRLPMLTGGSTSYLSAGFSAVNNFDQTVCALVLEPTPGRLNAIVVAEGGTDINDIDLGMIAGTIGGGGGAVYTTNTATMRGTMNGWALAIGNFANANNSGLRCDGSAGAVQITPGRPVMALWFTGGDTTAGLLYRNEVPGQPQRNEMTTPLVMNSVQTLGAACTFTGAIARDSVGAMLSCQSNIWEKQGSAFWEDPVATFAALPACNAAGAGQTRVVLAPFAGIGPRAYTCNGASWSALAINDAGNLVVPERLTSNSLTLSVAETSGAACTAGSVGRNAAGKMMSCEGGVWTLVGSSVTPTLVFRNVAVAGNTGVLTNNYGKALYLIAWGGHRNPYCPSANAHDLQGYLNGQQVAASYDAGNQSYHYSFISYFVPAGATFQVISQPWNCGAGLIYLTGQTL